MNVLDGSVAFVANHLRCACMGAAKGFMKKARPVQTYLSGPFPQKSAWPALLAALVVVVISILAFDQDGRIYQILVASKEMISKGESWRLWTGPLIHGDLMHLLSNLPAFVFLSFFLHLYFGSWIFPWAVWMGAALVHYLTLQFMPSGSTLVGASGALYLMAGFWAVMFMALERSKSVLRRLINVLAIGLIFLFPASYRANVSYLAHGLGLAVGIFMGLIYLPFKRRAFLKYEIYEEEEEEEMEEAGPEDRRLELHSSFNGENLQRETVFRVNQ